MCVGKYTGILFVNIESVFGMMNFVESHKELHGGGGYRFPCVRFVQGGSRGGTMMKRI
jgi:hypothetical protein